MSAALAEPVDVSALAGILRGPILRASRRLRLEALKVGMSARDAVILSIIQRSPGIGVSTLANSDQTSRPTMSSHVKRLEAMGWVRRTEDAADGRRSGFTVTPAGARKLETLKRLRNDWLAGRLNRLTQAERDTLAAAAAALHKLAAYDA